MGMCRLDAFLDPILSYYRDTVVGDYIASNGESHNPGNED